MAAKQNNASVLNPILYDVVKTMFGDVRVSDRKRVVEVTYTPRSLTGGRLIPGVPWEKAERYRVNCPFCDDARKNLAIHYLFGTRDPITGIRFTQLAKCLTDDCLQVVQNQEEFLSLLSLHTLATRPVRTKCKPPRYTNVAQHTFRLPWDIVPVNSEEVPAAARQFLERRGFDADELWDLWRVYYCESCNECRPPLRKRLVGPVIFRRQWEEPGLPDLLIGGWHARHIRDDGPDPSYLSSEGFRAAGFVYGITRAELHTGPLVVCKDIADVWRLRNNAVALFGDKIWPMHEHLILCAARNRPIVIFFDRASGEEAVAVARALLAYGGAYRHRPTIRIVFPPNGRKHPADCTREEAWGVISNEFGKSLHQLKVDLDADSTPEHPSECSEGLPYIAKFAFPRSLLDT